MNDLLRKDLYEYYKIIYKDGKTIENLYDRIDRVLNKYGYLDTKKIWLDETDSMLITYGDSITDKNEAGIKTLHKFMKKHVKDAISSIHILPMYPYTSDDGFSVVDYKEINPSLGNWEDVNSLSDDYKLMFDGVINHISAKSDWFKKYLTGEDPYRNYFIECDPDVDYSKVTRPRALPLLTKFETNRGSRYIWTTFSEDQIDLNYKCIDVYSEILDVLMFYAKNGAKFIRLDAIAFLWKEPGTTCLNLEETHMVVKSYRRILEEYAPGVYFITETNIPHEQNISYFGNGDEAHLVYQFPLPPLTMYSLITGDATKLTRWAKGLEEPGENTTFFNFLSSHDGIGVRPVEGILNDEERQVLIDATLTNGGVVSYKDNGDGTKSPYELNINYQDALASPEDSDEVRIGRFMAAETILMSMQGLPGIYIHSLLGSRNDYYGRETSNIPRRINRQKLDLEKLEEQLLCNTNRATIFNEMIRRLNIRKVHEQFSPKAHQRILNVDSHIFALERYMDGGKKILAVINVSSEEIVTALEFKGTDLLSAEKVNGTITLKPLQSMWILEDN